MGATPRSVVVTGASRGLGAALAQRFAAPGVALLLVARGAAGLGEVARACRDAGAEVETAALDVRDADALRSAVLAFDDAHPLDLVIANAGISRGRAPDGRWEDHAGVVAQVAVNLVGAINLIEPLLPRLRTRGAGHVALVASISAFRGMPDLRGYSASKAGLWSYGEALRAALHGSGVAVTTIAPGFFRSAMEARFMGAKPLVVSLDRATSHIERGLRRRARRIVFPQLLVLLLRVIDAMPAWLADPCSRVLRFRIAPEGP